MNNRAVIGLSGGVDSAVAAALLAEEGYDVTAVFLHNGSSRADAEEAAARSVSGALSIPLVRADIGGLLEREVCAPFAEEYLRGRTPSPCVLCNERVKFRALFGEAERLGADSVATGHYAAAERWPGGPVLLRDTGSAKDQSYMLCRLSPAWVSRCRFPLEGRDKGEIRAMAAERGIPVAHRPDSMEICFVPDGDYAAFVERRGEIPPEGDFTDTEGNVLGRHKGIHHYTVGQRKGLGIALGRPAYVKAVDPEQNRVVLAFAGGEYAREVRLSGCLWHLPVDGPFDAEVRVRYSRAAFPARVWPEGENARLVFADPVRAPAPGQAAAIYRDRFLTAAGWIG